MSTRFFVGIDVGASTTKAIILNAEKEVLGYAVVDSGADFEEAARIRDQIKAAEKTIERQNVVSTGMEDHDVIGLAHDSEAYQVAILFLRKGYLMGSRDFVFRDRGEHPSEIMEAFIKQYYHSLKFIPKSILIKCVICHTNHLFCNF